MKEREEKQLVELSLTELESVSGGGGGGQKCDPEPSPWIVAALVSTQPQPW